MRGLLHPLLHFPSPQRARFLHVASRSLSSATTASDAASTRPSSGTSSQVGVKMPGSRDSASHVLELVRARDLEGYLVTSFLPKESRRPYLALRAFNVEVSSVRDSVGDNVLAGQMRLQWWRDVVAECFQLPVQVENMARAREGGELVEAPRLKLAHGQPVAEELARAVLSVALAQSAAVRKSGAGGGSDNSLALGMTRKFLFNNIECREQDIEQDDADGDGIDLGGGGGGGGSESAGPGFIGGDINDLESFSEHCYGSLHFATLETLPGVGGGEGGISFPADDEAALNCAALLGRAQGLATALRAVPFNLSRGRLLLPRKLLLRHGVDEEALLQEQSPQGGAGTDQVLQGAASGPQRDALRSAAEEIAGRSWSLLLDAREAWSSSSSSPTSSSSSRALLSASATEMYLRRLESRGFDACDPSVAPLGGGLGQVELQLRMLLRSWRKSF